MDWLEDELKQALRRKEPSPDFDAKVVAAVARRRTPIAMPRWLATAAAVVVIVGGSAGYRYHQGQVAKRQVMMALRLTGAKLTRIQQQMKVRP